MRTVPVLLLLVGAGAIPAAAQWRGSAGVGLGNAPAGRDDAAQWSVTPVLRWSGARTRIELTGMYRDFAGVGRQAGGAVTGSWFRDLGGPVRLELTGTGRVLGGSDRVTLGAWDAGPRLHLGRDRAGGWLGAQAGSDPRGGTLRWEAALWRRLGPLSIQLQGWQSAAVSRVQVVGGGTDTLSPPDSSSRSQLRVTTDIGSWVHWSAGRLQLAGALGLRYGGSQPGAILQNPGDGVPITNRTATRAVTTTWWQAEASYWLNGRIALAGAVGHQPGDPALRAPAGRYLQLGFRLALDPRETQSRPIVQPRRPGLEARRLGAAAVELSLAAPGVRSVEVMGDFTDWRPQPMDAAGGARWVLRIPAGPGLYRFNVRYDGGPWQAPPGTRTVRDEFGGEAGVVLIP